MSWEDFDHGFSSPYDYSDNESGLVYEFDDGFSSPYRYSNNESGLVYDFDDEFHPQDDSEYGFRISYSGSPHDPDGGFCLQGVPFDGLGLQEDDSGEGFSSQVFSENRFGLLHDSGDGFSLQGDCARGFGLVYDFDGGFSLQGHCVSGFGSVDDFHGGFSSQGEHFNDGFGFGFDLEDDSVNGFSLQGNPFDDLVLEDDGSASVDDPDLLSLVNDFNRAFNLHDKSLGAHEAKWIKHYCNTHKILLVGEGNFSFAACLARSFGSATNMVATSLDSYDFILKNYGLEGWKNLESLGANGCKLIHELDAGTMTNHKDIGLMSFDRIVFNFPHAGFNKWESRQSQIQRHRNLVRSFFGNARRLLSIGGEIHVVHKTNGFFREWRIEELAELYGLQNIEKTAFHLNDYPGYQNKYGFGGNKNFDCYPSMTYKFALPTFLKNFPINQTLWPFDDLL